MAIHIDNFLCQ